MSSISDTILNICSTKKDNTPCSPANPVDISHAIQIIRDNPNIKYDDLIERMKNSEYKREKIDIKVPYDTNLCKNIINESTKKDFILYYDDEYRVFMHCENKQYYIAMEPMSNNPTNFANAKKLDNYVISRASQFLSFDCVKELNNYVITINNIVSFTYDLNFNFTTRNFLGMYSNKRIICVLYSSSKIPYELFCINTIPGVSTGIPGVPRNSMTSVYINDVLIDKFSGIILGNVLYEYNELYQYHCVIYNNIGISIFDEKFRKIHYLSIEPSKLRKQYKMNNSCVSSFCSTNSNILFDLTYYNDRNRYSFILNINFGKIKEITNGKNLHETKAIMNGENILKDKCITCLHDTWFKVTYKSNDVIAFVTYTGIYILQMQNKYIYRFTPYCNLPLLRSHPIGSMSPIDTFIYNGSNLDIPIDIKDIYGYDEIRTIYNNNNNNNNNVVGNNNNNNVVDNNNNNNVVDNNNNNNVVCNNNNNNNNNNKKIITNKIINKIIN